MPEEGTNETEGRESNENAHDPSPPTSDELHIHEQSFDNSATTASQNAGNTMESTSNADNAELQQSNSVDTNIRQSTSSKGPSVMDDHNERIQTARTLEARTQAVYEKAGVRRGTTVPFSATQERRNVPAGLRTGNNHDTGDASLEKNRTTGPPGAAVPGAVAVDMTGLSVNRAQRAMGHATQPIVDDNLANDGDKEEGPRPSTPPPSQPSSTAPRTPSDGNQSLPKDDSPSHSLDAESRSRRNPRPRHRPVEETKEEEHSLNSEEQLVIGLTAPPPMEDVNTEDDIEANVNSAHASGDLVENGDMPRAIEAELVTAENNLDAEAERNRLRTQAEQNTQERFLANAITAEAKVIDDEEEKRLTRKWKRYTIILAAVVVIILIVAVVVVIKTTKKTEPVAEGTTCNAAYSLTNLDGSPYEGNTERDSGDYGGFCQIDHEGGFGQWFTLTGQGSRLVASTCKTNKTTNSDTQILVFSEGCGDTLKCVGGIDQLCDQHGSVGWPAEKGTEYWILVRSKRASFNDNFTLTVEPLVTNGECISAMTYNLSSGVVFGSTRGLNASSEQLPSCRPERESPSASAWYRIEGDGNVKCAAATTDKEVGFQVAMSVFSNECNDLKCHGHERGGGHRSGIAWKTNNGTPYYLTVQGMDPDAEGDFLLKVRDAPDNAICEAASELFLGNNTNGTTQGACPAETPSCQEGIESENKEQGRDKTSGVWFKVTGNGNLMIASVCDLSLLDVNVQLSLFGADDDCGILQCRAAMIDDCGPNDGGGKRIQWWSEKNQDYRLLIESSMPTNFSIELQDVVPSVPDACIDAPLISSNNTSFEVGSTFGANPDNAVATCIASTEPGVFYKVVGTGSSMKASTCIPGTNQPTYVTIMTGDCASLKCIGGVKTSKCDEQRSLAAWNSVEGQEYIIHVAGSAKDGGGHFALTVTNGTIGAANDYCYNAEPLTLDGQVANGTTNNSTIDDVTACQEKSTSPGVWYMFSGGQETSVTASLCHDQTDFDTQLRVFTGDCTSLQCVAFNDDTCNTKSAVTWSAAADTDYYILVSGFEDNTGDFAISITTAEDF